jgi:hypothetical protein
VAIFRTSLGRKPGLILKSFSDRKTFLPFATNLFDQTVRELCSMIPATCRTALSPDDPAPHNRREGYLFLSFPDAIIIARYHESLGERF